MIRQSRASVAQQVVGEFSTEPNRLCNPPCHRPALSGSTKVNSVVCTLKIVRIERPNQQFRLARSIARAMSAAIWPWLARKKLASAAVTLTTTPDRPLLACRLLLAHHPLRAAPPAPRAGR